MSNNPEMELMSALVTDTDSLSLYIIPKKLQNTSINGYELLKSLPAKKILADELYLRRILNTTKIPKNWEILKLHAWGNLGPIFPLGQKITYFFCVDGTWKSTEKWLGDYFDIHDVAVVIGEVIEEDEPDLSPYDHNAIHNITEKKRGVLA